MHDDDEDKVYVVTRQDLDPPGQRVVVYAGSDWEAAEDAFNEPAKDYRFELVQWRNGKPHTAPAIRRT